MTYYKEFFQLKFKYLRSNLSLVITNKYDHSKAPVFPVVSVIKPTRFFRKIFEIE